MSFVTVQEPIATETFAPPATVSVIVAVQVSPFPENPTPVTTIPVAGVTTAVALLIAAALAVKLAMFMATIPTAVERARTFLREFFIKRKSKKYKVYLVCAIDIARDRPVVSNTKLSGGYLFWMGV